VTGSITVALGSSQDNALQEHKSVSIRHEPGKPSIIVSIRFSMAARSETSFAGE
jgi:hypothetical protein